MLTLMLMAFVWLTTLSLAAFSATGTYSALFQKPPRYQRFNRFSLIILAWSLALTLLGVAVIAGVYAA